MASDKPRLLKLLWTVVCTELSFRYGSHCHGFRKLRGVRIGWEAAPNRTWSRCDRGSGLYYRHRRRTVSALTGKHYTGSNP